MAEKTLKTDLYEKLVEAKRLMPVEIEESVFFDLLFEMNKFYDKSFVEELHKRQITLNQNQRNRLRLFFYHGKDSFFDRHIIGTFPRYQTTDEDKLAVLVSFLDRCERYNKDNIINSIIKRFSLLEKGSEDISQKWFDYYNQKRINKSEYSLLIIDYSQSDFIDDSYDVHEVFKRISYGYKKLENYRYFAFKIHGTLTNKTGEDVTWQVLYKIGIFCENFYQFTGKFYPFKKEKQISTLANFISNCFGDNNKAINLAQDYYSSISTGFVFEDCYISNNQSDIFLIYKKIELDESPVPCPACLSTLQRGNSYPELFLRSYECQNPQCPERTKRGRGKRFDEYGSYRFLKLIEANSQDEISDELYSKWRRDIFSSSCDIYEMLIN